MQIYTRDALKQWDRQPPVPGWVFVGMFKDSSDVDFENRMNVRYRRAGLRAVRFKHAGATIRYFPAQSTGRTAARHIEVRV